MKTAFLTAHLIIITFFATGQAQKVVGDCTVTFSISGNDPSTAKDLAGAVKTLYIRGKLSRVDISNSSYQQSVIYNGTTGDAVILQQVGANKYISRLSAEKWSLKNSHYQGTKFNFLDETKTILGYECKKGTATLKDGCSFTFYYVPSILPSATENPYQFKEIPGFVLEYEITEKNTASTITYTANKINFNPVPESKFDIPTTGYLERDNSVSQNAHQ